MLDITEFNDATSKEALEAAELEVLSILRNFSAEANLATDLKLSDDGNYAFIGSQALVPYDGGSNGEPNEGDPAGNAETSGGVVAVDISDPENPQTVDRADEPFTTGCHNLFHHRIDGTDYVFACKDLGFLSVDSGVYIFQFVREPVGKLVLVNRWTADGNTARGEVGAEHGLSYVHDVEVHDDPRTGRPTAYVADWDRGMRILDISDPTNIEHVGQFDMNQAHFAAPFPTLLEMPSGEKKRVAVASHEEPDERFDQEEDVLYNTPHPNKTNPNSTGTVFLIDCDAICPEDPDYESTVAQQPTQLGELDNWTWKNVDTGKGFDESTSREERFEAIRMPTFSYQFSPHNSDPAVHEIDGEERYIIHQGHYHGGVRYLEVNPGVEDGLTGDARRDYRPNSNPNAAGQTGEETIGWINNTTDWDVVDVGHARPANEEIDRLSPDFWSSVVKDGVSYHGDRNAGVHVTTHDEIPVERSRPAVEAARSDDSVDSLGEDVSRVTIEVEAGQRPDGAASVRVRDRVPSDCEVVDADGVSTYPQGNRTAVEFEETLDPGERRRFEYLVSPSVDAVLGAFGPVEIRGVEDAEWAAVGGTTLRTDDRGRSLPE